MRTRTLSICLALAVAAIAVASPVSAQPKAADRIYVMDCGHNEAADQSRWSPEGQPKMAPVP